MIDIAEAVSRVNMFELAQKTNHDVAMTDVEAEVSASLDAAFRKIGETGHDKDHEISAFLRKTVNQEVYEAPDEVLDAIFERSTIGEFDDYQGEIMPPENTLEAYEAGFEGTVPNSYLDFAELKPTWVNEQIESEISFADLRRGGWKTVAALSEAAVQAFKNAMYNKVFTVLDGAIASGADNYITEPTTMPTSATMDALATYIGERTEGDGIILGLYKYIQAAGKLQVASEAMKDEMYRKGILGYYGGIPMKYFSSAKKVHGQLMFPDKRIFGVAKKIGVLSMKGDVNTYQVEEPGRERIQLYWKNFTFGYAFNADTLKNVAKIVLA